MEIKVGDIVRIKSWERMEQEYGTNRGNIRCLFTFIAEMKYMCEREFKVSECGRSWEDNVYYKLENSDSYTFSTYTLSTDMFESVNGIPIEVYLGKADLNPLTLIAPEDLEFLF